MLYPTNTNNELFVEAKENCEILSFIYDNIMKECNTKCKFHKELEKNLPILIMNNTIKLNTRIELLTKKNIRNYELKMVKEFPFFSMNPSSFR